MGVCREGRGFLIVRVGVVRVVFLIRGVGWEVEIVFDFSL